MEFNNPGILFLAPFPNRENIRDGMVSRVQSIDNLVSEKNRAYLYVSLRRNRKKSILDFPGVRVYNLNVVLHLLLIIKVLKSYRVFYIHSLHMAKHIFFLLPFLHPGKIILDAHGIVPEEERYFRNNRLLVILYQMVEAILFRYADHVICVTRRMIRHFENKYPDFKGKFHIYRILPSRLNQENVFEFSVPDQFVRVLYSGGIAPWQKVDKVLESIERNQSDRILYTILTGKPDFFKEKMKKYRINPERITVNSVDPSELYKYYREADYGFILRDDNPVNNVANPTKLIEYLYYGMIPIMLSKNIGDYSEMDIDFLPLDLFNDSIQKPLNKSVKNMHIAKKIITQNNTDDLLQLFESISC